jgi:sugar diacid utilization regulator
MFSTKHMLEFWDESVVAALADGRCSLVRAAGEMTWALRDLPGSEELFGYESELNRFLPRYPQVFLCLYDLDRFGGEMLVDVLKTHPKVLVGGRVVDNPYYLEPEELLSAGASTVAEAPLGELDVRGQLSSLRSLLVLSMLMTENGDEAQILNLATSAVPSLGRCRTEAVYLDGRRRAVGSMGRRSGILSELDAQIATLGAAGGRLRIPDRAWVWGYSLTSRGGALGHLVVAAAEVPPDHERFLLHALAQQTGVALANARFTARERANTDELRIANLALRRSMDIHERLTRVAVAGEVQEGIARAMQELTGYSVAVEDHHGNLWAWAGPNRPDPYPRDDPTRRKRMLRRALRAERPVREKGRLIAVARLGDDVVGVLVLHDPEGTAGEQEQVALEHGATVLAMELARVRSRTETELRLRRDLVEDLLAGTDEQSALSRAQALGYELERKHRVVMVEGHGRTRDNDALFHAVRRAARDVGVGSLLVARAGTVVVLSDIDQPWERFRGAVSSELGGGTCRLGVGGQCDGPGDFPRSHREAQLALKMQKAAGGRDLVTVFEDLGLYRVLCEMPDSGSWERLIRQWLGALLDYDARRGSQLVGTLSAYLDSGGNYDATSKALSMHRSGLKYRLQRIREVSGYDLVDPDTRFNLHLACRAWRTLQAMRES